MKTRTWCKLSLLLAPLMISCTDQPQGQLVLAFQTDVALPKDIDFVKIQAVYADNTADVKYENTFLGLGTGDGIKLPGTLGFLAPEKVGQAIRIRVIAGRRSDPFPVFHREVITTVPQNRTVLLPLPIEYLCNGFATPELGTGSVQLDGNQIVQTKSTCDESTTCKAGACADADVPSDVLADYDEGDVYGGGTHNGDGICFDTASCFNDAKNVKVDLIDGKCQGTLLEGSTDAVNIGLFTKGGGICGASGCFVALDFDSDGGWKAIDGKTIELPMALCDDKENKVAGRVVGVVAAKVQEAPCTQKTASIPTCGPWSASRDKYNPSEDPNAPVYIATGQMNPITLQVIEDPDNGPSRIFWTSKGGLGAMGISLGDGSVNMVRSTGGEPLVIAKDQPAPSGLAVDDLRDLVFWANEQGPMGGNVRWAPIAEPIATSAGTTLVGDLQQPAGMALGNDPLGFDLYYSDVVTNDVSHAKLNDVIGSPEVAASTVLPADPSYTSPRSIATSGKTVCVTYESMLGDMNGVVACGNDVAMTTIATQQETPRAVVIHDNFVYWANLASMGPNGVLRAPVTGGATELVADVARPAGLAVDATANRLYITSRSDRKIHWVSLGSTQLHAIEDSRPARGIPGAIALDSNSIYWMEESEPGNPIATGAVLKIAKP